MKSIQPIFKYSKNTNIICECYDGYKIWYLNGKFHREDGPAVEFANGTKDWFLNGYPYSKKDYYKELVKRGIMTYEEAVLEVL